MANAYRKLYRIQIAHSYYTDANGLRDFVVRPLADTVQMLRDHRMRFIQNVDGVYVSYESLFNEDTGDYDPFIPATEITDGTKIRLALELQNPWFFNFTDLSGIADPKELRRSILFYTTVGATPTMADPPDYTASLALATPEWLTFQKAAFSYVYTLTGNPASGTLRLISPNGAVVRTYSSTRDEANKYTAFVEMSRLKPGRYSLQRVNEGVAEGDPEYFYFDPDINPAATFAVIELVKDETWETLQAYNADPSNNGMMKVVLSFQHRVETWNYKVVFKNTALPLDGSDPDYDEISISEFFAEIPGNRYHVDSGTDTFEFEVVRALGTMNGYDMVEVLSVDEYPLYQETKKNLSLKVGETEIYADLPNPDYKNLRTEVIIYV
ncbi:MAG: hypothetical protein U0176_00970 [Bacteroidia bacterium]